MREDFLQSYLDYTEETECPIVFHRWACLSVLGAWLGRAYTLKFGHSTLVPNLYCMLMGSPGTRKSTAIKIATGLIKQAGYTNIAADRSTKEKFLLDLAGEDVTPNDILTQNLFGSAESSEILIAADEFNSFIGNGNIEFLSMLGVLWDYNGLFKNRVKNSKSIEIQDPTVSILAGNTPVGFTLAFPTESIGQGIFSRILLVHGEPTGKKITFPVAPDETDTALILGLLQEMRLRVRGEATITDTARNLLDTIYKGWQGISDVRFESYSNRRFTQLMKLCLILSAARLSTTISEEDVIYANTILVHTEHSMPQALGAFGKAKNSDVSHKVLQVLESARQPVALKDLWKHVHHDLEDMKFLSDILRNLMTADKIQAINGSGFLAKKRVMQEQSDGLVDFSLLTPEERKYIL